MNLPRNFVQLIKVDRVCRPPIPDSSAVRMTPTFSAEKMLARRCYDSTLLLKYDIM